MNRIKSLLYLYRVNIRGDWNDPPSRRSPIRYYTRSLTPNVAPFIQHRREKPFMGHKFRLGTSG